MVCEENLTKQKKMRYFACKKARFFEEFFLPRRPSLWKFSIEQVSFFFLWINVGSHSFLTHLFVRVIISNKWKGRSLRWNRRPLLRKITTVLLHWPQQSEQWPAGSKTIKRCMESLLSLLKNINLALRYRWLSYRSGIILNISVFKEPRHFYLCNNTLNARWRCMV